MKRFQLAGHTVLVRASICTLLQMHALNRYRTSKANLAVAVAIYSALPCSTFNRAALLTIRLFCRLPGGLRILACCKHFQEG